MDYASDPTLKLIEKTEDSIKATELLIQEYNELSPIVKPIITPRFALTSTRTLLKGLARLVAKYKVPVQTHLSENKDEILQVKAQFPEINDYIDVYKNAGLLTAKCILAHCVHSSDREIEKIKKANAFIAHCPQSNLNLISGLAPVRKFLDKKINLGIGSDIAAGHTNSIINNLYTCIQISKIKWLENQGQNLTAIEPIKLVEAFYLATKGGGSFFGKVGIFEPDYEFDALIINDKQIDIVDNFKQLTLEERFARFIYIGSEKNIERMYVAGKIIPKPFI